MRSEPEGGHCRQEPAHGGLAGLRVCRGGQRGGAAACDRQAQQIPPRRQGDFSQGEPQVGAPEEDARQVPRQDEQVCPAQGPRHVPLPHTQYVG